MHHGCFCTDKGIWLVEMPLNNVALLCCVALHSWNAICIIHTVPLSVLWGSTWNDLRWRSVYRNPPRSLPLLFPLLSYRKHALNCHRMKPALFSVLCEIKEKTGEFLLHSLSLCSPVCIGCNLVLRCTVPLLHFLWDQVTFLLALQRTLLIISVVELIKLHVLCILLRLQSFNQICFAVCCLFGKIIIET